MNSLRTVALSPGLGIEVLEWRSVCPGDDDGWVFPSEHGRTPVRKDNLWRRHFAPRLQNAGLEWVNFQVMRRTHASLMNGLEVDPKLVAEQLGHTLDVSLNVYTKVGLERRKDAVELLESALLGSYMEHFGTRCKAGWTTTA